MYNWNDKNMQDLFRENLKSANLDLVWSELQTDESRLD